MINSINVSATTANVPQKSIFNLDPKIETPVVSNVTSSDDTEKLLENLTVCKPTSTNNDNATCESCLS